MEHDDLILRAIDKLSSDTAAGFRAVHDRLDALNGRTRKGESAVAVLDERTSAMACADHSARVLAVERKIERLERTPGQAAAAAPVDWKNSKVLAGSAIGLSGVIYAIANLLQAIIEKMP